jgi:hypothetical protein
MKISRVERSSCTANEAATTGTMWPIGFKQKENCGFQSVRRRRPPVLDAVHV